MELKTRNKVAFCIGAFGKDVVYMLITSYLLYYYNTVLKMNASFIGTVLMGARVFDAFNDPIMGIVVAKTKTKWGRFRPWILAGSVLNAVTCYALFATPQGIDMGGKRIWLIIFYLLWGITYTLMDIPFWSMVPAITKPGNEREQLSSLARSASGIGNAVPMVLTMIIVPVLSASHAVADYYIGFKWWALIVAVCFAMQVVAMLLVPVVRKKVGKFTIFIFGIISQIVGFILLLLISYSGIYHKTTWMLLLIPGIIVYVGYGILNVMLTVFLSDSVDYGEVKNSTRDESVIFSMQTFTVKLAGGIAILVSGVGLDIIKFNTDKTKAGDLVAQSASTLSGLRALITIPSIICLIAAFVVFIKFYKLNDNKMKEITDTLSSRRSK
ncbi:MAG: MFS transporter [Lachnospiraceae bacterium]|nr:MFS transporter [Lachnospiraceae bacterium]